MKQQIFIDDIHEYDYEELTQGDVIHHNLYYSNGGEWQNHVKGMIAMIIADNGNGLIINEFLEDSSEINYSEAEQLFILLKLINPIQKYEIGTKKLL
jgi:hypothetical protein